ncbi:arginase [Alsobacter soli]|uniref:Arginase n=1 Tax=Alsobacter soli TaxID=2109933 RepID=A0A2T1HX46_9HYPH|nr:arginase [Alsobacter soli]
MKPADAQDLPSVALLGIPLEYGAGARGTLMGPAALRTAGLPQALAGLGYGVTDHGDIAAPDYALTADLQPLAERCRNVAEVAAWTRVIHDRAYEVLQSDGLPIFMGGDHSLSMGSVSAVARRCREQDRDLVVLWVDAHSDFNTPETTPSGNMHGMSVAFLCGDPSLAPLLGGRSFPPVPTSRVHLFGIRSIDAQEREAIHAHGLGCSDMRAIDEFGVSVLMRQFLEGLDPERTHLHVSLDVDFLDPHIAPGVGTTVPGGATYREAHLVMELLHDSGLVGSVDLVELNPFLDERGKSALLMADLASSLLGRSILLRREVGTRRPSLKPNGSNFMGVVG